MKYDIIVVGSGPGGYVAAIRAALIKSPVSHGIHAAFFFTLLPSLPYHYEADELYQKSHSGTRRMYKTHAGGRMLF